MPYNLPNAPLIASRRCSKFRLSSTFRLLTRVLIYLPSPFSSQSAVVSDSRSDRTEKRRKLDEVLSETASITSIGILNVRISVSLGMPNACESSAIQYATYMDCSWMNLIFVQISGTPRSRGRRSIPRKHETSVDLP